VTSQRPTGNRVPGSNDARNSYSKPATDCSLGATHVMLTDSPVRLNAVMSTGQAGLNASTKSRVKWAEDEHGPVDVMFVSETHCSRISDATIDPVSGKRTVDGIVLVGGVNVNLLSSKPSPSKPGGKRT
jgi:hypothetical protein